MDSVDFSSEEVHVAQEWHGGLGSMLYALASTGALSRGTHRPYNRCSCNPSDDGCAECKGTHRIYLTDDQWLADLASRLESEASAAADEARLRAKRARRSRRREEANEMKEHASILDSIAAKCSIAIRKLGGES